MTQASLPQGFQASGSTCGIKASGKPDLSLFVSDRPASSAGVFTTNKVCGAPVIVSRERVPTGQARAVIINSGNSNAATGEQGIANAKAMTAALAEQLKCAPGSVLVCSTGVIGVQLPMPVILKGIPAGAALLGSSDQHLLDAATSMMTTDTFPKLTSVDVKVEGGIVRVAGVCKGAAMIAPNMATMLSVVMTDAALTPDQCQQALRFGVDRTFNCISVDGHMSTSDTVLLLANGASGVSLGSADLDKVRDAIQQVCQKLATDIIRDAEGADHFITIDVMGLSRRDEAYRMAKEIADSALVKTAITGGDPNWGRIVAAAGRSGARLDPELLVAKAGGVTLFERGAPAAVAKSAAERAFAQDTVVVELDLGLGGGRDFFLSSGLTEAYVRLNADYST